MKQTSRNRQVHFCWATREPRSSKCMYVYTMNRDCRCRRRSVTNRSVVRVKTHLARIQRTVHSPQNMPLKQDTKSQCCLSPQNAIALLYSRHKATARATTYFSRRCHVHVLAAAAYASPQFDEEHTQELKNAWGPRSACSGASQTARDNCWRPRFIVFAPRFIATSRRFK